eukprot:m.6839 g.6839  ORF g.6839 m.6839 type:complete len:276 (+) comp2669_c0_seq1:94-921(+)
MAHNHGIHSRVNWQALKSRPNGTARDASAPLFFGNHGFANVGGFPFSKLRRKNIKVVSVREPVSRWISYIRFARSHLLNDIEGLKDHATRDLRHNDQLLYIGGPTMRTKALEVLCNYDVVLPLEKVTEAIAVAGMMVHATDYQDVSYLAASKQAKGERASKQIPEEAIEHLRATQWFPHSAKLHELSLQRLQQQIDILRPHGYDAWLQGYHSFLAAVQRECADFGPPKEWFLGNITRQTPSHCLYLDEGCGYACMNAYGEKHGKIQPATAVVQLA